MNKPCNRFLTEGKICDAQGKLLADVSLESRKKKNKEKCVIS
jgi:hypothetical protein